MILKICQQVLPNSEKIASEKDDSRSWAVSKKLTKLFKLNVQCNPRKFTRLILFFQKLFGHKMADFHLTIEGVWSKNGKGYKKIKRESRPGTDQNTSYTVKLKRTYCKSC